MAKTLRRDHGFRGYIHLKIDPRGEPLADRGGRALRRPALDQSRAADRGEPGAARAREGRRRRSRAPWRRSASASRRRKAEKRRFSPAGQSTQVIVGADATTDEALIRKSAQLYGALQPASGSITRPSARSRTRAPILPLKSPPLQRENRLYQADWLLRYYGFTCRRDRRRGGEDGMLDLDIDPKLAWALEEPRTASRST